MGDHLRKWRLDRSLLQSEIAERLGVDQSTITNCELNRTAPALHLLPRLHQLRADPSHEGGEAVLGFTQ
jgi:transcriptional regulator with XRE-family HTH domain